MATDYKILGQVQTSDAPAQENINLYPDPNHERYTASTTFNAPTPTKAESIWVWDTTSYNTSHAEQHWPINAGSASGTTTPGRTDYIRFSTHENTGGHDPNHQRRWDLSTDFTGTLTAGKTYTIDLWAHAHIDSSNHHGQHGRNELTFWDGAAYQYIVGAQAGDAHSHLTNVNNTLGGVTQIQTDASGNRATWSSGWRRYYRTFIAAGSGKFTMKIRHAQHSQSYWVRTYIDNIYVAEGAIPKALIPSKAPDGTSGNPLALYTSPFTTRSEGWAGTAYQSATTRKFTGDWQNLYQVPDVAGTSAVCSTLTISNASSSTQTYRIAVQKFGETLSQKHFIAFDHSISAFSMETLTLGITLARQDKIIVQSDSNRLQFSLFGSENSL